MFSWDGASGPPRPERGGPASAGTGGEQMANLEGMKVAILVADGFE
jgi:hypothetical protein